MQVHVDGPYHEWADFLNDQKCGGRPEPEWRTVTIGETYKIFWCGTYEETRTVTQEDKAWFERQLNDPTNDVWTFEKEESSCRKSRRPAPVRKSR